MSPRISNLHISVFKQILKKKADNMKQSLDNYWNINITSAFGRKKREEKNKIERENKVH